MPSSCHSCTASDTTTPWPTSVVANPQMSRRADACTRQSSIAGESMAARAGRTHLWVLIEHPGPWPASAPDDVLPRELSDRLDSVAGLIRVVLIRRPNNRQVTAPTCLLAWSDGIRHWMREGAAESYDDLVDLPFETMAAGLEPSFGRSRRTPFFAVCTHGKKDACCAELGRPIVSALTTIPNADVWECSHIGGDRFAANMIAWPSALYFSRLGADSAVEAVNSYLAG